MAILEVQDIHTYYGDAYVLQGLSMQLEQGRILGLLGRNGVGKSTLVNSIVGFNPPRRGRIIFKGADITQISSFETVRSGMGLVPQGRRVFSTLSVEENLLVAERNVDRKGWNLQRVYALFPRLLERRDQRAKTLSGGEQQMLAIGRGLMTNPDCLIMDEPSEGLAPIIIQGVWGSNRKAENAGDVHSARRTERPLGPQARRLRARDEQGQNSLFRPPGRTAGKRANQVQLSGHLTSLASSDVFIARTTGTCWCVIRSARVACVRASSERAVGRAHASCGLNISPARCAGALTPSSLLTGFCTTYHVRTSRIRADPFQLLLWVGPRS